MRKIHYALLTTLLLLCISIDVFSQSEIPDNKGKEFWVMFNRNFDNASVSLNLFITGEVETSGEVELPDGTTEAFSVVPGSITTVGLPSSLLAASPDGIEDKGVKIISEEEITVYGLNQKRATTDAFLALPTDILETEYIVMSYINAFSSLNNASLIGIVATEDNTTITIVPSSNAGSRTAGVSYTINLNRGQTYQLQAPGANNDLTGTIVTSNNPVAVFGGHTCANVPPGFTACDHMIEQIPPASAFGTSFVTVPLATRTGGDIFRILASSDGTSVSATGSIGFSQSFTLNRGEYQELDIPSNEYTQITATEPVLVVQYSKGQSTDNVISDPFMLLIPPFEQFQNSYTVTTPEEGFNRHFINLAVPNSQVGNVTVDGSPVPASDFTTIASTGFSGAQVEVEAGTHNLNGTLPFGAFMYGFGNFDSYGYPGGQALGDVAIVEEIALSLEPIISQGNEYCFIATAIDDDGNPIDGVRIDFSVSGANNTDGFVFTDAEGQAQFCYIPENIGEDIVTATVGNVTAQATITIEFPVPSLLTLDPETVEVEEGVEVCITGTVFDQFGEPLEGVEIFTEIDGEIVASGTSDENGEVVYCFTPNESGIINVVCYYEGGERVTARVTVTSDGGNGDDDPRPTTLTLDPETTTVQAGVEVCITGTVLDQFGDPLPGVEIFTEIDGEVVGSGISDKDGEVVYCFTPTESGVVSVVCYYTGGERVTAEVTVLVPTLTFTVSEANGLVTITCTVLDQFGNPFPGETVTIDVSGANSYNDTEVTNAQGVVTFVYTAVNTGTDLIVCSYSQGDVTESIQVGNGGNQYNAEVASFTLVNAETDQDVQPLQDGDIIDLANVGEFFFGIRATTSPDFVGSVVLQLDGPNTHRQTENLLPYSLFGDSRGQDYQGELFPPGQYTLTATPYSEKDGQGIAGTALTVQFEVVGQPAFSVQSFTLINAETDQDVQPLQDGDIIDLANVGEFFFGIRATTSPDFVGSVVLQLDGPNTHRQTENLLPYSLFGDSRGQDYQGELFPPGQYTLTATPYSEKDGQGIAGTALTVQFEVVGQPAFSVQSFTLINAETDQDVQPLQDGDIIDLASIGEFFLSVRATTSPNLVGSVIMELDGPSTHRQTENLLPYSLFGDSPPGDYEGELLNPGQYTLTATPYSEKRGQGTAGTPLTIQFTVIGGNNSRVATVSKFSSNTSGSLSFSGQENQTFTIYPIPSSDEVNVVIPEHMRDNSELFVYDEVGKLVYTAQKEENQSLINLREYGVGFYLIRLVGSNDALSKRVLIK